MNYCLDPAHYGEAPAIESGGGPGQAGGLRQFLVNTPSHR